MKNYEKKLQKEIEEEKKKKEQTYTKLRRSRNKQYTLVSGFFVLIFLCLAAYLVYFHVRVSDEFVSSPYNTRQDTFADRVVRGRILSTEGEELARTNVYEDGTEERIYPYSNIFAHVVGFDSNGKSGLESEANFRLLTSHEFFIDQMKNQMFGGKSQGDDVISSLSTQLQMSAYYSLGDRRGAVIVMEPSTGRILAMVSKPDFDPNYMRQNYQYLVADENDSSLLNRATNGAYPPGSTFKLVTALDYYRQKGTFEGYNYICEGTITKDSHTIRCYNSIVHGQEDFYRAFANSCNCSFADIGLNLGAGSLRSTAEDLLFNKKLPFESYKTSIFSLNSRSPVALTMQTAIGQGNTLVSPAHMCLLACAVANGGRIMKPTLVDRVVSASGEVVRSTTPTEYKRLFSENEANLLEKLMLGVVQNGTASALSGRSYQVYGKTGSAEFDENGSSHSWFIGYGRQGEKEVAMAIIVENGGTGSESAVPIASEILESYYNNF